MNVPALVDELFTDAWLKEDATVVRMKGHRLVADVISIGDRLRDSRERIDALFPGRWGEWLKREFNWTEKTAENYMNLSRLAKSESLSEMNWSEIGVPLEALYRLASPRTPRSVVVGITARAEAGEKVSLNDVKDAIQKTKPRRPGRPKGSRSKPKADAPGGTTAPDRERKARAQDDRRQQRRDICTQLTGALDHLKDVCAPVDAVRLIRASSRTSRIINERLDASRSWLNDFARIWEETKHDGRRSASQAKVGRNSSDDADTGEGAGRTAQSLQSKIP